MNDPQIADYLNKNNIPSIRGKTKWEGKNIWAVRYKFSERDNRSKHKTLSIKQIKLITPNKTYEL